MQSALTVAAKTKASLTLWRLAGSRDFHARTTGSQVALHMHSFDTESGRELFKG